MFNSIKDSSKLINFKKCVKVDTLTSFHLEHINKTELTQTNAGLQLLSSLCSS